MKDQPRLRKCFNTISLPELRFGTVVSWVLNQIQVVSIYIYRHHLITPSYIDADHLKNISFLICGRSLACNGHYI